MEIFEILRLVISIIAILYSCLWVGKKVTGYHSIIPRWVWLDADYQRKKQLNEFAQQKEQSIHNRIYLDLAKIVNSANKHPDELSLDYSEMCMLCIAFADRSHLPDGWRNDSTPILWSRMRMGQRCAVELWNAGFTHIAIDEDQYFLQNWLDSQRHQSNSRPGQPGQTQGKGGGSG